MCCKQSEVADQVNMIKPVFRSYDGGMSDAPIKQRAEDRATFFSKINHAMLNTLSYSSHPPHAKFVYCENE